MPFDSSLGVSTPGSASEVSPRVSRRSFLSKAGASVVAASALPALLARGAAASSGKTDLTFALFQNPDTLDPAGTSLVSTGQVLASIFEPLMYYIPAAGGSEHFSGLAESYTISRHATTYTFKLRRGVTFHDGTPFDASAVKATLDHIVNPATKAESELGSLGPYKETRVLNTHTAQVVFAQPNASFINEMSTIYMSSPTALKKYGSKYGEHPVGTGPFIFQQFISGQQVTVKRNPDYRWAPAPMHHSGPAPLQNITFRVLSDPSAQYDALQTGELDVAQSLNPPDVLAAIASKRFAKFTADAAGLPYSLVLNTKLAPTDDIRVRQALQYATNKAAIIRTLYKGLYEAAGSVLTPATLGYERSQAIYNYDPAKAAHLLNEAGWTKGAGGKRTKGGKPLSLSIINATDFGFDNITQLLQSQFQAVGVQSAISDQAFPAVNATYEKGVMNLSDWFYADVDPSFLSVLFACDNIGSKGTGFNTARICSASVDNALVRADGLTNTSQRAAAYSAIATNLMKQAVALPIYDLRYIYVGPSTMKGIQFTRDGTPLFHAVTL